MKQKLFLQRYNIKHTVRCTLISLNLFFFTFSASCKQKKCAIQKM